LGLKDFEDGRYDVVPLDQLDEYLAGIVDEAIKNRGA
jgi:hypothetical protein